MNKRTVLIFMQVVFWIIAFSFTFLLQFKNLQFVNFSNYKLCESLIVSLWFVGNFYLFYAYLVPKLLANNKFKLFVLCLIAFLIISPVTISFLLLLNKTIFSITGQNSITIVGFLGGLFGSIITGGIGLSYRIMVEWIYDAHKKTELENKNLESELQLLKAKLNPHFLFNTINNIDALIEESPKKASELLSKLSDLLRYVLYEVESDKIELTQEINIIEKYIELQRIRVSNTENIHLNINSADLNYTIPPMLFIPFIENAFKHSDLNKSDQHISIELNCIKNTVKFTCKNNFVLHEKTEGIGLELIKKRLELYYPNSFSLDIYRKENIYEVNLFIDLHEN